MDKWVTGTYREDQGGWPWFACDDGRDFSVGPEAIKGNLDWLEPYRAWPGQENMKHRARIVAAPETLDKYIVVEIQLLSP